MPKAWFQVDIALQWRHQRHWKSWKSMAILSLMQFMLWMGLCGMWVLFTHVYAESIYGADKETDSTDNLIPILHYKKEPFCLNLSKGCFKRTIWWLISWNQRWQWNDLWCFINRPAGIAPINESNRAGWNAIQGYVRCWYVSTILNFILTLFDLRLTFHFEGTQEAAKMLLIQPITGMTMSVLFGCLEIYNKFPMKYILILTNWQGLNLK